MSTSVWPPIAANELKHKEEESLSRELAWLLESLQETLEALKSGLEECYALLAPVEPGSTLVVSSVRSEAIKGTITRVGTRIVKGSLNLRLKTHPPTTINISPTSEIPLDPLINIRTLLNQALDCVDITRWTGDRHSASFISGQLRLLHSILAEARSYLRGPPLLNPATPNNSKPSEAIWPTQLVNPSAFSPPLPDDISLHIEISEASLILTIRTLEDAEREIGFGTKFAFAIGAQRRLEHDEMDGIYTVPANKSDSRTSVKAARQVRVKEKVRVESADPSLMSAMAKIAALEHNVGMARMCLAVVMGEAMDEV